MIAKTCATFAKRPTVCFNQICKAFCGVNSRKKRERSCVLGDESCEPEECLMLFAGKVVVTLQLLVGAAVGSQFHAKSRWHSLN